MAESIHKFLCKDCHIFLFGDSVPRLVSIVNTHITTKHPMTFAEWTETGITRSVHYVSPANTPRPQYTRPFGTTERGEWGDAKPPIITEEDIEMLRVECGVKW